MLIEIKQLLSTIFLSILTYCYQGNFSSSWKLNSTTLIGQPLNFLWSGKIYSTPSIKKEVCKIPPQLAFFSNCLLVRVFLQVKNNLQTRKKLLRSLMKVYKLNSPPINPLFTYNLFFQATPGCSRCSAGHLELKDKWCSLNNWLWKSHKKLHDIQLYVVCKGFNKATFTLPTCQPTT